MKFIMAYSGGKDCTLALDRMIRQGHEPAALYTTITSRGINYNHFIRTDVYRAYEDCLGIPVFFCHAHGLHSGGEIYGSLKKAVERYDAEAVCTGDIYQGEVASWNQKMAERLGVEWACPLWNEPTEKLIDEVLERGYRFLIKSVTLDCLGEEYLGREITRGLIAEFGEKGIDVCGENGEYHSLAVDGPIFRHPLPVRLTEIVRSQKYATCDAALLDTEAS